MSDGNPEKKGGNWIGIFLTMLAITAGRLFWTSIEGDDLKQEKPPYEIVPAEKLGIDPSAPAVQIDEYNDGRIVVDGVPKSLDEIKALIPEWKAGKRLISSYHEPRPKAPPPAAEGVGQTILEARLPFSWRDKAQATGQGGASKP